MFYAPPDPLLDFVNETLVAGELIALNGLTDEGVGITAVFFNGAAWPRPWLDKVFPGTPDRPHQPDAVVDTFEEFRWLVEERLQIAHE